MDTARDEFRGWQTVIAAATLLLMVGAGLLIFLVWQWDTSGGDPLSIETDFRTKATALAWGLTSFWTVLVVGVIALRQRAGPRWNLLSLLAPVVFTAAGLEALATVEHHIVPFSSRITVESGVTGCDTATPATPAITVDAGLTSVSAGSALGLCSARFTAGDPSLGLPEIGPYSRYLVIEVKVERRAGAPAAFGPSRFTAVNQSPVGKGEYGTTVPVAVPAGLPELTLQAGERAHGWVAFRVPDYARVVTVMYQLPAGGWVTWTISEPNAEA